MSAAHLGALALAALALPCAGQEILFHEDFESGGDGWTASGSPAVLWHVSADGECGAVTRMAVYNRGPDACDYRTGGKSAGTFLSPVFVLGGAHSIVVQFDYLQDSDDGSPCVEIVDEERGKAATIIGCSCCADPYNAATLARAVGALDNPALWAGKEVRLRFGFDSDSAGNRGFGCMVDNVLVIASGPSEEIFRADFEGGAAWTAIAEGPAPLEPPLWHRADPGECGAVTHVGAYNRGPAGCDYVPRLPSAGRFRSPPFRLRGAPPFLVEFDSLLDMEPRRDTAQLHLVDPVSGKDAVGGPYPISATLTPQGLSVDPPGFWSYWSGKQARLEFSVSAGASGHVGAGWLVDNVRIRNSGSLPVLPLFDGRKVLLVEWPRSAMHGPHARVLGLPGSDTTLALVEGAGERGLPVAVALLGAQRTVITVPGVPPAAGRIVDVSIGE